MSTIIEFASQVMILAGIVAVTAVAVSVVVLVIGLVYHAINGG